MQRIPARRAVISGMVILTVGLLFGQSQAVRLSGYSAQSAAVERAVEEKFKDIPSQDEVRRQHRYFTAQPHPAGSKRNNDLARYIAATWRNQGWEDVTIHQYDVLVSSPREVAVEMVAPVRYRANLHEDSYDIDPDTKHPSISPGYLALSASGEVTAPLVYAHSGNPEDYDFLRRQGIDVKGKVVIVRYSSPYSYRGFKALTAERMGAAAILIYSDPAEDGYARGKVYPDGPWGPESHIQRGAITYDFIAAGDPLTPGWPSIPGAKHIAMEEAVSLPRIVAVPLSWRDAKPLLENMDGPEAPKSWRGGLKINYRLGGAAVRVRVKADMDTRLAPNYVVEARMYGDRFPDQWVVMGNHRDAWEFGGVDPSSGTASMMELARALGELKQQGTRPHRTLVLCSWDGEEVGLTGSTEWGEQFAEELKKKVVAYLNVDSSVSGPHFAPSAVASLAPLVVEVARSIRHPSGRTLYEEWRSGQGKQARGQGAGRKLSDSELVDTRIGSGSDHTVFLNFLGRPTVGLTFDGPYGVYHSIYDNFYWMNRFGDPGYRYHKLATQVWGVLALRLANADLLPFDFEFYGRVIQQFIAEVQKKEGVARELQLGSLIQRAVEFRKAGKELKQALEAVQAAGPIEPRRAEAINRRLMEVEGSWLNPAGIPGRPWFKHVLYATRFTYAHLELPGLTEAVEKKDWKVAQEQAGIVEGALAKNTALVGESAVELKEANPRWLTAPSRPPRRPTETRAGDGPQSYSDYPRPGEGCICP